MQLTNGGRWSLHYKLHCADFMFLGREYGYIAIYIIYIYINNIYDYIIGI